MDLINIKKPESISKGEKHAAAAMRCTTLGADIKDNEPYRQRIADPRPKLGSHCLTLFRISTLVWDLNSNIWHPYKP